MNTPSPDLQDLERRLALLEAREAERRGRVRRLAVVTLAVVAVGAPLALAADGLCPTGGNGLPFCFAGDAPAKATEVNHNFAQLREWLINKVGPTSSNTITSTGITTTTLTASSTATFGAGATIGGTASVNNLTIGGNATLGTNGTALFKAMSWCDCEINSQLATSAGIVLGDIGHSLLWENPNVGVSQCRDGRFLVGIEKTSNNCTGSIGCLEQFKCCRPCNLKAQ